MFDAAFTTHVTEAIRFLVSPRASCIQGVALAVDGGKTSVVAK
jgi:hypothetical protein